MLSINRSREDEDESKKKAESREVKESKDEKRIHTGTKSERESHTMLKRLKVEDNNQSESASAVIRHTPSVVTSSTEELSMFERLPLLRVVSTILREETDEQRLNRIIAIMKRQPDIVRGLLVHHLHYTRSDLYSHRIPETLADFPLSRPPVLFETTQSVVVSATPRRLQLPTQIWKLVFQYQTTRDLFKNCYRVCRSWLGWISEPGSAVYLHIDSSDYACSLIRLVKPHMISSVRTLTISDMDNRPTTSAAKMNTQNMDAVLACHAARLLRLEFYPSRLRAPRSNEESSNDDESDGDEEDDEVEPQYRIPSMPNLTSLCVHATYRSILVNMDGFPELRKLTVHAPLIQKARVDVDEEYEPWLLPSSLTDVSVHNDYDDVYRTLNLRRCGNLRSMSTHAEYFRRTDDKDHPFLSKLEHLTVNFRKRYTEEEDRIIFANITNTKPLRLLSCELNGIPLIDDILQRSFLHLHPSLTQLSIHAQSRDRIGTIVLPHIPHLSVLNVRMDGTLAIERNEDCTNLKQLDVYCFTLKMIEPLELPSLVELKYTIRTQNNRDLSPTHCRYWNMPNLKKLRFCNDLVEIPRISSFWNTKSIPNLSVLDIVVSSSSVIHDYLDNVASMTTLRILIIRILREDSQLGRRCFGICDWPTRTRKFICSLRQLDSVYLMFSSMADIHVTSDNIDKDHELIGINKHSPDRLPGKWRLEWPRNVKLFTDSIDKCQEDPEEDTESNVTIPIISVT